MIRPIGIQHPDLGQGRVSELIPGKIFLDMLEILQCHGQSQRIVELRKLLLGHLDKTIQNGNVCRLLIYRNQCLRFDKIRLPGIHRVDAVGLNPVNFLPGQLPV